MNVPNLGRSPKQIVVMPEMSALSVRAVDVTCAYLLSQKEKNLDSRKYLESLTLYSL